MTTSLKNRVGTVDKVAGAGATSKIEGKSKELLGRVLEELGEWLDEPATARRGVEKQADGKLKHYAGENQDKTDSVEDVIDSAKEAAADTARRLKELF